MNADFDNTSLGSFGSNAGRAPHAAQPELPLAQEGAEKQMSLEDLQTELRK
jgi:hypothetical protein